MAKRQVIFREVPHMGVYHVMVEAANFGYRPGRPDWCDLGQGQPEVGRIEGAPSRLAWITLEPQDHAYGPIGGIEELREAVADTTIASFVWTRIRGIKRKTSRFHRVAAQ